MALGSSRCCWADEPGLEGLFITTQLYCQKIPYKVTVRPISKRAANDLEGRSPLHCLKRVCSFIQKVV